MKSKWQYTYTIRYVNVAESPEEKTIQIHRWKILSIAGVGRALRKEVPEAHLLGYDITEKEVPEGSE